MPQTNGRKTRRTTGSTNEFRQRNQSAYRLRRELSFPAGFDTFATLGSCDLVASGSASVRTWRELSRL